MRTKTLLLTAALTAAGVVASMAAGVTSVNVVGYINVTVPSGFSFIANQLSAADLSVGKLITTANPGSVLYTWNNGFFANVYASFFDPADPTTLVWDDPSATLPLGSGALVYNPGSSFTVTFVGEVAQGNLVTTIKSGFNFVSSQVPQEGGIQTVLGYNPTAGDVVYTWQNGFFGNVFAPFYDPADPTTQVWDSPEPVLKVGQSVLLYSTDGHSWNRTFNVQ